MLEASTTITSKQRMYCDISGMCIFSMECANIGYLNLQSSEQPRSIIIITTFLCCFFLVSELSRVHSIPALRNFVTAMRIEKLTASGCDGTLTIYCEPGFIQFVLTILFVTLGIEIARVLLYKRLKTSRARRSIVYKKGLGIPILTLWLN